MISKKIASVTIDFETWFQIENLSNIDNSQFLIDKANLNYQLDVLLDFLSSRNIYATFFVLGNVAKKVPKLINEINKNGHEIASHGYSHKLNFSLTDAELKNDIKLSKIVLMQLIV